jgi:hypothetical protein
MSLLKKVKAGLSKRYEASKQQRQERHVRQAALSKDVEKARYEGYRKGSIARARTEGFRQAKTKPSGGMFGNIGAGLNFMNQDFGTAFSGKTKPKHIVEHEGKTGKGVTIQVDGTTIHVGKKERKKTVEHKRIVRKKKSKNTMFDLF